MTRIAMIPKKCPKCGKKIEIDVSGSSAQGTGVTRGYDPDQEIECPHCRDVIPVELPGEPLAIRPGWDLGRLSAEEQAGLLDAAEPCSVCGQKKFQVTDTSVVWSGAKWAKLGNVRLVCSGCEQNKWVEVMRSELGELVLLKWEGDD